MARRTPRRRWLDKFVYGLPELHREQIRGASYVSGVGCNATASNLALLPLVRAGLLDAARDVVVEVKVGSSEGGAQSSDSSHHPERSGAVRSFAPTGHRHTAEIGQATGLERVHLSITSVELVRGALATAHVFPRAPLAEKDLWRAYRAAYSGEPFVRIVRERQGTYRLPEPKILAGSNYADVGFALDEATGRVVSICAIDNLMKGAAGSAVQCMNLMCGFDERAGLGFPGLHPFRIENRVANLANAELRKHRGRYHSQFYILHSQFGDGWSMNMEDLLCARRPTTTFQPSSR